MHARAARNPSSRSAGPVFPGSLPRVHSLVEAQFHGNRPEPSDRGDRRHGACDERASPRLSRDPGRGGEREDRGHPSGQPAHPGARQRLDPVAARHDRAGDRRRPGVRRARRVREGTTGVGTGEPPMRHDAVDPSPRLVRELGRLDATMIVMGSMIGSGIFITSAESARLVGAPGWLLVAWTLAGVMTITGALCCAEIAAMLPRAGGQYVFLREAYGPLAGFLFGWSVFLVVQTGTIAAVSVAFAKYLGVLIPPVSAGRYLIPPLRVHGYAVSLSTQQLVALTVIAALTATNTRGLRTGARIQNSFTFTKTAALLGLVVVGLTLGANREAAAWTASWWDPSANGWSPSEALQGLPLTGSAALAVLL